VLPLAATTTTPAAQALSTAVCNDEKPPGPPRLMLITLAPCATAQSTPCATPNQVPEPPASSTFTGMILHDQQTPAMPAPLFVFAAMMPETNVPWP
jgi:hypothetical protein